MLIFFDKEKIVFRFTPNQKFISMRSVSVATFGWKASAASPSNKLLSGTVYYYKVSGEF